MHREGKRQNQIGRQRNEIFWLMKKEEREEREDREDREDREEREERKRILALKE